VSIVAIWFKQSAKNKKATDNQTQGDSSTVETLEVENPHQYE
jgi:hypothetical protein